MLGLATNKGLAVIILCLWTFVCEADPTKDEKDDLASIKKKLAEQEKQLAEQKSDLAEQKNEKADLAQQLKKLQDEFAKEKISAFKLRKADKELLQAELDLRQADEAERAENQALRAQIDTKRQEDEKRQLDVVSETKKLIRAEIETYLNTQSVCQMGSYTWTNPSPKTYNNNQEKKITFAPPFPKTPKAQAALKYVIREGTSAATGYVDSVSATTKTGMQFRIGGLNGVKLVNAMWIACL